MKHHDLSSNRADALLLLTALIWGLAFTAQRSGMAVIGPFAFSAARFALGGLALLPFLIASRRRPTRLPAEELRGKRKAGALILIGLVLFVGANLQQIGLVYTTAANAGFVTSLYVVLVPIVGVFLGKRTGPRTWIGAVLAVVGLYVLSVGGGFAMNKGDLLVLGSALVYTAHILLINHYAERIPSLEISLAQIAACAGLSLVAALLWEPQPFAGLLPAAIPLLYGGLLSIALAYTLQIVAQRTAHPARASIIMSLEALFAGVGGVLILHEPLTPRLAAGGALMLTGVIVSQWEGKKKGN